MREPPDLARETITGALDHSFGIQVERLDFLPVGDDSGSWSYRVQAAQGTWFLKVRRRGAGLLPGAAIPTYLHRHGIPGVLAPLPTRPGDPAVEVGRFALMLYPMVQGATAAQAGLSPRQWRQLGAVLRQIHGVTVTPELARAMPREPFWPTRRDLLPDLEPLIASPPHGDRVARELAGFWRARADTIRSLVDRADTVGRQLARSRFPQVVCHADLHTWNVLVDTRGQLWIVDWDEAIIAPRERDLMFVVGGIGHGLVRPGDTAYFLQGYGETTIDHRLLGYYRVAWAVQDIAAYAESVLLLPGLGEATRRDALDGFVDLFEPGNIVDLAGALGPP